MTKKDFVTAFAKKNELKLKEAEKLVSSFLGLVEESLMDGQDVRFIGFGSWEVRKREGRTVKNPMTKKPMKIKAKKVVKFKVGKTLADKIATLK